MTRKGGGNGQLGVTMIGGVEDGKRGGAFLKEAVAAEGGKKGKR